MYGSEKISNAKIILLLIGFAFLIVLTVVIYHLSNKNYEKAKVDTTKNYVYKREGSYSGRDKNLPFINVEGDDAKKMNQEIAKLEEFANLPDNKVGFVFNKSGPILSICIKLIDYYTANNHPVTSFQTYNLNLETKKVYTKEEIYRDYEVHDSDISKSIEKNFKKMYEDVVEEGYLDSDFCDYDCFLKWRGVENYLDGAKLYIENQTLTVFRGFLTESLFGEERYFSSKDFKFVVSK